MMKVKGDNRGQLITCYYPIYIYHSVFSMGSCLAQISSWFSSHYLADQFFFLKTLKHAFSSINRKGGVLILTLQL